MNIKDYKSYLPFAITIGFFIIALSYATLMYLTWNNDVEDGEIQVEVKLPVINWNSYTTLSKQYDSAKIKDK